MATMGSLGPGPGFGGMGMGNMGMSGGNMGGAMSSGMGGGLGVGGMGGGMSGNMGSGMGSNLGNMGGLGNRDGGMGMSNTFLNLRIMITREEVQYLFGADETLLQLLRQQTGANIQMSDPGAHERVVSIAGGLDTIFKAFSLVCRKLWEFVMGLSDPNNPRPLVLRLAVPAQQCGSIIGKQGAKIKEIRDLTGAQINVSQESLPDSNERTVEIIGSGESCLQTTYHVCCIMQETPIKGEVIPYIPKSLMPDLWRPIILAADQAYIIENGVAVLAPPQMVKAALAETPLGPMAASIPNFGEQSANGPDHMNPIALMAAISNSQRDKMTGGGGPEITKEMMIDNAVAGSVIGKSGSKVGEIRKISGAQVHISTEDEMTPGGERVVTMSGTPESVLLAQFLVQSNIDLYKRDRDMERGPGFGGPLDSFVQNEAIRNNPEAMNALNQMNSMMGGPGRSERGKGGFGRGGPNNGFGRGGNNSFDRGGGNNSFDRGGGGGNRDNRGGGGFGRGGRRSPMEGGRRGNGGKQKSGRRR